MTAWTAKDVEYRLLEAAETLAMLPGARGPSTRAGFWPEYIPHYPAGMNLKWRPSAGAIARMERAFSWVNDWLGESDRKTLYAWLYFRTARQKTVAQYAATAGMSTRTLRREITSYCAVIAARLNKAQAPLTHPTIDKMAEILAHERADSVDIPRDRRSPTHMMTPGSRPEHDASPEAMARIAKSIERSNRRVRTRREGRNRRKSA